jgi:putative protease
VAEAEGEALCETARNVPLSKEKCTAQLMKCGGTPYTADEESIEIIIDEGISLPLSDINNLRRKALSLLSEKRTDTQREKLEKVSLPKTEPHVPRALEKRARIKNLSQLENHNENALVFMPIFSKDEDFKNLLGKGVNLGIELPRGMFGREEKIRQRLHEIKALGITTCLTHNLGGINLIKDEGFTMHGGFSLNICNSYALLWAEEEGFESVELSFELTDKEINSLGGKIPRGIVSGGYLPLMLCRTCPGKLRDGGCSSCNKTGVLQDRLSKDFIFSCEGNSSEILNCVPLKLYDRIKNFSTIDFHIHRFSVENSVEKVENSNTFSSKHQNSTDFTRGLYFRGVK